MTTPSPRHASQWLPPPKSSLGLFSAIVMSGTKHNSDCWSCEGRKRGPMCRAKNSDAGVESMDDFKDLFETPAPSLDDPSTDPVTRARIWEWISLAMSR